MLEVFPFVIRGFHSDNGSEYVNKTVAGLLATPSLVEAIEKRFADAHGHSIKRDQGTGAVLPEVGPLFTVPFDAPASLTTPLIDLVTQLPHSFAENRLSINRLSVVHGRLD